jgi:hypothetical protein
VRFNPFAAYTLNPVVFRNTLLCDRLILPVVPHFFGDNTRLLSKWRNAGEALTRQHVSLAGRILLSDDDPSLASDSETSVFLFNAAQLLLSVNAQTSADHCIQKGLSLLAGCRREATSSFNGSLWLVMASIALNRGDLESGRVWLRQGRQCFDRSTASSGQLSPELTRWHADWCSIEACCQAGAGDWELAERLLSRAHQDHVHVAALNSAAKDRILRSRLQSLEHHWEAAESDLMDAQTLVERSDSVFQDYCGIPMRRIIASDLNAVRTRLGRLEAANWN